MREINQTIKVYKFNELDENVQQKVLDKRRYWDVEGVEWYESDTLNFKERLGAMGFTDVETAFSGFYSQGDGASFTADIDYEKMASTLIYCSQAPSNAKLFALVARAAELGYKELSISINRDTHQYPHEKTCSVHWNSDYETMWGAIDENKTILRTIKALEFVQNFDSKQKKIIKDLLQGKLKSITKNNLEIAIELFVDELEDLRLALCKELYNNLESTYESLTSDEYIKSLFDEYLYEFKENGDVFSREGEEE